MTTLNKKYNSAFRYAHAIDPAHDRDLLHDAYIAWFNRTGKNLFDEHDGTIRKVIKLERYNSIRRDSYMIRGKRIRKNTSEYNDGYIPSNSPTPEEIMIAKDIDKSIMMNFTSELQLRVYLYAVGGCGVNEIATLLGMGKSSIRYYFKKMAYTVSLFN